MRHLVQIKIFLFFLFIQFLYKYVSPISMNYNTINKYAEVPHPVCDLGLKQNLNCSEYINVRQNYIITTIYIHPFI